MAGRHCGRCRTSGNPQGEGKWGGAKLGRWDPLPRHQDMKNRRRERLKINVEIKILPVHIYIELDRFYYYSIK